MDAEGLKEIFEPFGSVAVKRMFGGHGVYADGLCFAIETDGEVYLKVDDQNRADFEAAGLARRDNRVPALPRSELERPPHRGDRVGIRRRRR